MMKVSPLFYLTGIGMVAVAVVSLLWITGAGAAWSVPLLGGAAWLIAFAQKITWAAKFNKAVFNAIKSRMPAKLSGPGAWGYVGLVSAVFESGFALIFILLFPSLRQGDWLNTLAFGVGFGAAEALFIGLGQLGYVGYNALRPENIPENERERWKVTADFLLNVPVGIVERAAAVPIHIYTKALLIMAVQQNAIPLFLLSFGFKFLVDAIAGWMHLEKDIKNVTKPAQCWGYESIFVILALISIAAIMHLPAG